MSNLRQAAQQALEVLLEYQPNPCLIPETQEETDRAEAFWDAIDDLRAALAEPRPIQECYGDCPTDPATCLNPCNFEGRPKPEQKPQTTHWEGCEAVHPECEAAKAERKRICDMLLDMHAKEERHNHFLFIANIIKESK